MPMARSSELLQRVGTPSADHLPEPQEGVKWQLWALLAVELQSRYPNR